MANYWHCCVDSA